MHFASPSTIHLNLQGISSVMFLPSIKKQTLEFFLILSTQEVMAFSIARIVAFKIFSASIITSEITPIPKKEFSTISQ